MELEDVDGIGPETAKKLRKAGVMTVERLASSSTVELRGFFSEPGTIGADKLQTITRNARELLGLNEFKTAYTVSQEPGTTISTGIDELNQKIGGGIETKGITELYGEYGTGKTQFCLQLSVTTQLLDLEKKVNGSVLWMDTEETYRWAAPKIAAIGKRYGLADADRRVHFIPIINTDHLEEIVHERAEAFIRENNVKLIVVDSLAAPYRADYVGRDSLPERQQHLGRLDSRLLKHAIFYDLAVVITNQVIGDPSGYGLGLDAALGHRQFHASTFRFWIRKAAKGVRIIKAVDCPHIKPIEVRFLIQDDGLHGVEEKDIGKESKDIGVESNG